MNKTGPQFITVTGSVTSSVCPFECLFIWSIIITLLQTKYLHFRQVQKKTPNNSRGAQNTTEHHTLTLLMTLKFEKVPTGCSPQATLPKGPLKTQQCGSKRTD